MGVSSIPVLFGNEYVVGGFLISGLIFFIKGRKFDRFIFFYCLIFLILFVLHVFAFKQFIYGIFVAYFLRILFAYFVVKIVGRDIDKYIIQQIYFFSIIGLLVTTALFFFPNLIDYIYANVTPIFDEITIVQPNRKHFIIYTMELGWNVQLPRNAGPFWEPGGFGIFIFIALTFNILREGKFFSRKNIIFIITILTTQSTAAYLALFVFGIIYIFLNKKLVYSIIIIPCLLIVFNYAYTKLDFLGSKVEGMYEDSQKEGRKQIYSRIRSGQINLENFNSSPLFGIGRFFEVSDEENTGNNGTTLLLAEFGAIGFLLFFVSMYRSYRNYCISNKASPYLGVSIIAGLLTLGYSQGIFQKPFFFGLSFMFLFDTYARNYARVKFERAQLKFMPKFTLARNKA